MGETALVCGTVLAVAWLARGAHDARLRAESERGRVTDSERLTGRLDALEREIAGVQNATALRRTVR